MTVAIKVENLSKKYIISHEKKAQGYKTLSESLMQGSKRIANKIIHPFSSSEIESQTQEEFWALKDINFEINQGDKVGIIGRNGAGKSTLLKVLSRITDPTSGKIHINGRIASLLEVGTGFHPELTGRENIYLNGAILGMSRKEIKLKFDEIVAFAEVDKFLDTPVKRYSSGMYVRLAFAVAAHLESEILVVDEVLAVGDAEFQKKCLGKMDDVSKEGRTILFVSHNMAMISSLCDKGLLMQKGQIKHSGTMQAVVKEYFSKNQANQGLINYEQEHYFPGDDKAKLLYVCIKDNKGEVKSDIAIGEDVYISMEYELLVDNMKVSPNFHVFSSEGACAFVTTDSKLDQGACMKMKKGVYIATCKIPANYLNDDVYFIGFALTSIKPSIHVHFFERNTLQLHVIDKIDGTITRNGYSGVIPGVIRPVLDWSSEKQ